MQRIRNKKEEIHPGTDLLGRQIYNLIEKIIKLLIGIYTPNKANWKDTNNSFQEETRNQNRPLTLENCECF